MKKPSKIGDRVRHATFGWIGIIQGPSNNPNYIFVKWDHQPYKNRAVLAYKDNISILPRVEPIHSSYARMVGEHLLQLLGEPLKNSKDDVVRRLGLGTLLASRAKTIRDTARADALRFGIISAEYEPGVANVYDSPAFSVVANTSEPSTRISDALLRGVLAGVYSLSPVQIQAIIDSSRVPNKPATRFAIEEK